MKKISALFLATVFILCSCSNDISDTPDVTEDTENTTVSEEPSPYPFTLNDSVISKKPEKVVCLSPALAEIIYEIGYGDKIIGRGSYCDYPASILSADDVGSSANPNIDKISDLMPDLVITSSPIASKDIFTMEQAGITTVNIPAPTTIKGFESIYTSLGLIFEGMFTGNEKGEEAFSTFSELLSDEQSVNVGKFAYITENLSVAGGDTFESNVLSLFGINVAENSSAYTYDLEMLVNDQPDIIFVNDKYTEEDILSDETLSQLDAANNGKIIYINNIFFERPSSRISELINKLKADYENLG